MSAELYQALIMDRSKNPRYAGRPARFDAQAEQKNALCGDQVQVFIDGPDVRHESRGCAIMTASADLMAEAVAGKPAGEIAALNALFEKMVNSGGAEDSLGELNALAGVSQFRSRIRCAILPWAALAQALEEVPHG
jgi:nitrogen fixation NifU-like protein